MEIRLLGKMEVLDDAGRSRDVGALQQRAVLATFALRPAEAVSVAHIVDALWDDDPPASAVGTIRAYVSNLRRKLAGSGVTIETAAAGYELHVRRETVDAIHFEELIARARSHQEDAQHENAAALFRRALELWRGPALADFTSYSYFSSQATRLAELRLAALHERLEADLALGRHAEVVGELHGLVAEHPLHEGFRGQLMRALHGSGRRADALRVYRTGRDMLVDELGIEPRKSLRRLEQAILQEDPAVDLPRTARQSATSNVPESLTTFVGRERELAALSERLERARLVTLTGVGGVGKTRLAIEVARRLRDEYADGPWLIECATLDTRPEIVRALATVLGVREEPDRPLWTGVTQALQARRCLLVFDNCEHVLSDVREVVAHILERCPAITILATSQARFGTAAEAVHIVRGLDLPEEDSPLGEATKSGAVQLFLDRAEAVGMKPRRSFGREVLDTIRRICRRLDGIPLALELAAARLDMLTLEQLTDGLDKRFRLLTRGDPTASPRQRTLRATVQWSYSLLNDAERVLFRRLGVFAGAFSLDRVRGVCAFDPLDAETIHDVLAGLVTKSLVTRTFDRGGKARYRLLETLRQFARLRLHEHPCERTKVRETHAHAYLNVAETHARRLHQRNGAQWTSSLDELESEHDDLRRAGRWLETSDSSSDFLRFAGSLWRFWDSRYYVCEGLAVLEAALGRDDGSLDLRLEPTIGAARLALVNESLGKAREWAEEGLPIADELDDRRGRGLLLLTIAEIGRYEDGPVDVVEELIEEALALLGDADDPWGLGHAHRLHVLTAWDRGDFDAARQRGERCRQVWDACGDLEGRAGARALLGGIELHSGNLERSLEHYETSLDLFRHAREPLGQAQVLHRLAAVVLLLGDVDRSRQLAETSLSLSRRLGEHRATAFALLVLADASWRAGDRTEANELARRAHEAFAKSGFVMDEAPVGRRLAWMALRDSRLDAAREYCLSALSNYERTGQSRDMWPTLLLLARIELERGDTAAAQTHVEESLEICRSVGDRVGEARALELQARLAHTMGRVDDARSLFEEAQELRAEMGVPMPPSEHDDIAELIDMIG